MEKEVLKKNSTVGKTIIEYAKINKVDVIVIGTKGMTAVEEYFFGSLVKDVQSICALSSVCNPLTHNNSRFYSA